MNWLWICITLMEWVAMVLIVRALGNENNHIEPRKTVVYFLANLAYYAVFWYFSLPQAFAVIGYVLLYGYICWCYQERH